MMGRTPLQRSFIDVAGIRTSYLEAGSGPALLLIHGGDYRSFAHSCDWSLNIEALASAFHVIAIDKVGQGFTDNPKDPSDYTMQTVCNHVEGFVRALKLDSFAVAGHSRGALPAARIAMNMPDAVNGLLIVDSNTLGRKSPAVPTDFYIRAFANMPQVPDREFASRELIMNSFSTEHISDSFVTERLDAGLLEKSAQAREIMNSGRFQNQFLPDADRLRDDTLQRISDGELQTKTLVAWGREDVSAPLSVGLDLFETIASASKDQTVELHVFNRSGHYPYREHASAFNSLVTGFLTRRLEVPSA